MTQHFKMFALAVQNDFHLPFQKFGILFGHFQASFLSPALEAD
jgi:hypothetical protein